LKPEKLLSSDIPRYTFIDLFAGIGGTRLAFEQAGGKCVFSSEVERGARRTYCENFGETPEGDIKQIPADKIPDHDILVAGFPCQTFSISGVSKRGSLNFPLGFDDPTYGTLFFDIKRILKEKHPRAFLLENVKHLKYHDKGRTFKIIRQSLEDELGYHVYYRIIDSRTVVPQHRERIFMAGFRNPTWFSFPELPDLKPKLRDILESRVDSRYTLTDHLWQYLRGYAARHKAKGHGFTYGLADPDGIARTLSSRYYKDGSEILIPQEGKNPRRLTPRECARLMGFPDWFKIPVSDTQAYRQFGNSVVVPVVKEIAKAIIAKLQDGERHGNRENFRRTPAGMVSR